ncbi:MAG: hypothetical protein QOE90_2349 [Thermoplasmata archaeon]|jgi:hypothetical protein|nr:hypothetical protein [Thermoplasmata archaeon]
MTRVRSLAPEVANLINPSFCGYLLRRAAEGYAKERGTGIPFELTFLVLPIVLHEETRQALPPNIRTKMHPWLQETPVARLGFASRARALSTFTRNGLLFASTHGIARVDQDGRVWPTPFTPKKPPVKAAEVRECLDTAELVGRWLAQAGNPATIYLMWGIQP